MRPKVLSVFTPIYILRHLDLLCIAHGNCYHCRRCIGWHIINPFPWLIPLSMHKGWIFILSGILIAVSGYLTFRKSREVACDTSSGEKGCEITGRFNKRMFYLSSFIFLIGGFVSYLLTPLMNLFN